MFRYIEEELTLNVRLSTMANLKAECHEHLTRPRGVKYDEEMNICLLESHLKMIKSHANVESFDENVSHLSTSMNLYEPMCMSETNHFFMNKTAIELTGQTLAPLYNIVIVIFIIQ